MFLNKFVKISSEIKNDKIDIQERKLKEMQELKQEIKMRKETIKFENEILAYKTQRFDQLAQIDGINNDSEEKLIEKDDDNDDISISKEKSGVIVPKTVKF